MVSQPLTPNRPLVDPHREDRGAHRPIQNHDPLAQQSLEPRANTQSRRIQHDKTNPGQ